MCKHENCLAKRWKKKSARKFKPRASYVEEDRYSQKKEQVFREMLVRDYIEISTISTPIKIIQ